MAGEGRRLIGFLGVGGQSIRLCLEFVKVTIKGRKNNSVLLLSAY